MAQAEDTERRGRWRGERKHYASGEMPDYCDRAGAILLKRQIEEYWRERGCEILIELKPAGFIAAMRGARTDVRSDMKNGLPAKVAALLSQEAA